MAQQLINIGTANNAGDGEGLRPAFDKTNDNFTELYQKKIGFVDYNDLATSTTPINIGTSYTLITNDGLGVNTIKTFLPSNVNDIFDTTNNRFDFQDLKLGDMINYRLNLEITTTGANQELWFACELGTGGTPYFSTVKYFYFKTAGSYPVTIDSYFDMGNTNTLNNYGRFLINSPTASTLINNGMRCQVTLY